MGRKISIICTLGPSSLNKKFMKLTEGKISLFRLNMSHLNLENDLKHLSELLNLPENLFEVFKTLQIGTPSNKDYSIVDSESQKIIYKNAFNFFKEFNYNENI